MLEQVIRRVDFAVEDGVITARFGPLMNDSQIKNLGYERTNILDSLFDMNLNGWRLESFASIVDVNQIRIQIAIFSRNIPA
jgi:hypothetical protein